MKSSYIIAFATAMTCGTLIAGAQNFNPKVEVTNTYEGKVMDVRKQDVPMNVPDSLLQFEYNVVYSVFDNPYKGSYEFKPYMIEMKPDARMSDEKMLYLRAGAGYTIHPELDFVLTPKSHKAFRLSVYDTFRGFYGSYGAFSPADLADAGIGQFIWGKMDRSHSGYLFNNKFGLNGRYVKNQLCMDVDAGYRLIASKDTLQTRMFHAFEGSARLRPSTPYGAGAFYGAGLSINYGTDGSTDMPDASSASLDLPWDDCIVDPGQKRAQNELSASADASFGIVVGERSKVVGDVDMAMVFDNHGVDAGAFNVCLTPKYVFETGRASISAGLKVSLLNGSDNLETGLYSHKSQYIYPDIRLSYIVVPEQLKLYADVTGGDKINSYRSLVERNPFAHPFFMTSALDFSSESVNFRAGLKGNAGKRFQFDLSSGYVIFKNGLLDAVTNVNASFNPLYCASYMYSDYDLFDVTANMLWKSSRFDMDAYAKYQLATFAADLTGYVAPAPVLAGLSATYNWNRRVYAGLSVDVAGPRNGYLTTYALNEEKVLEARTDEALTIPGYVDLGVNVTYKINQKWSVWAKGGNLLNDAVQQYFMHCERGAEFTLGFCWNL